MLTRAAPDALSAAEASYLSALRVARHQQAKSWELKAATGLARLWALQSKHAEARDLLAPVIGWFAEGLETTDLKDAKAVLEALASSSSNCNTRQL